jgi:hypothetical protein
MPLGWGSIGWLSPRLPVPCIGSPPSGQTSATRRTAARRRTAANRIDVTTRLSVRTTILSRAQVAVLQACTRNI